MVRLPRNSSMTVAAGVLIAVVAIPGIAIAAYHHAANQGKLPGGTEIGGVNAGGLSRNAAITKVTAAADAQLDRPVRIVVGTDAYTTTARKLGVKVNPTAAVDAAYDAAADHGSFLTQAWRGIFGGNDAPKVDLLMSSPERALVRRFVNHVHAAEYHPARDANAVVAGAGLRFVAAKPGSAVSRTAIERNLNSALATGKTQTLNPHAVAPAVKNSAYNTTILVHVNENKLYLYKHHKIVRTFPVATGQSIYPTPLGQFKVELKRYMPTWYNPHSVWSMNEPETIPPGPSNPLGLRALNLTAPGIRIHGSPADYSIGYNASHGCIRMHNSDVVQLYPLVPTGTPVIITAVGPYHPLGSSYTPTTSKPTDGEGG